MKARTYKKTNKKHNGLTVYKGYLFGEFEGYYYKKSVKEVNEQKRLQKRVKSLGIVKYQNIPRKGLTHKQLEAEFV